MTKAQLQTFKVAEIVTTQGFQAIISYLQENYPKPNRNEVRDGTRIVNEEGFLRGYLQCVEDLKNIAIVEKKPEKTEIIPYQNPKPEPKK